MVTTQYNYLNKTEEKRQEKEKEKVGNIMVRKTTYKYI